jgi:hypothetical protein
MSTTRPSGARSGEHTHDVESGVVCPLEEVAEVVPVHIEGASAVAGEERCRSDVCLVDEFGGQRAMVVVLVMVVSSDRGDPANSDRQPAFGDLLLDCARQDVGAHAQ